MPCVSRCLAVPQPPSHVTTAEINVLTRKSAGSMCVLITPHLCMCVYACARFGASVHTCARALLIPRGCGWEKQVRKQQNKLRDNEENNTGTCFHWCVGQKKIPLRCCSACNSISGQLRALYHLYLCFEPSINSLSSKHAWAGGFFGLSYVARCPSWHSA